MKKLFVLVMCVAAVVSFASCKSTAKKASDVALEHAKMLQDGNYDAFVEEFHFNPAVAPAAVQAEKTTYKHALKTKVHPVIQSKGGIKSSKVVSETVAPDGKTATVVMNHEYNNGQSDVATYELAHVNGSWKIHDGHQREVWRTQSADGEHMTIKLKENEHKEVMKEHEEEGARDFVKEKEGENKEVLKVKEEGERDVEKVKEHKNGTVVTKEKHDGHREVTRTKAE